MMFFFAIIYTFLVGNFHIHIQIVFTNFTLEGKYHHMANTASTLEGKHLLVSDSNETSKQFDSKKLEYGVLVELAQDNLFKTRFPHLYSRYLNKWQYDACKDMLE